MARPLLKGNRANIPEPGHGDSAPTPGCQRGNANAPGDAGGGPLKNSLFFVRGGRPGIDSVGDSSPGPPKAARLLHCQVRSHRPLKNLGRRCDFRAGPYPYLQHFSKVSAIWIRNFGKRIGSEGRAGRAGDPMQAWYHQGLGGGARVPAGTDTPPRVWGVFASHRTRSWRPGGLCPALAATEAFQFGVRAPNHSQTT